MTLTCKGTEENRRTEATRAQICSCKPDGYFLISSPRQLTRKPTPKPPSKAPTSNPRGGTAFLIREPATVLDSPNYMYKTFETSSVTLKLLTSKLAIFNIYRPPLRIDSLDDHQLTPQNQVPFSKNSTPSFLLLLPHPTKLSLLVISTSSSTNLQIHSNPSSSLLWFTWERSTPFLGLTVWTILHYSMYTCLIDLSSDSQKVASKCSIVSVVSPSQKRTTSLKKPSLDTNFCFNYRPISNLSFLSNTLERFVSLQFLPYLEQSSRPPANQSDFRAHILLRLPSFPYFLKSILLSIGLN